MGIPCTRAPTARREKVGRWLFHAARRRRRPSSPGHRSRANSHGTMTSRRRSIRPSTRSNSHPRDHTPSSVPTGSTTDLSSRQSGNRTTPICWGSTSCRRGGSTNRSNRSRNRSRADTLGGSSRNSRCTTGPRRNRGSSHGSSNRHNTRRRSSRRRSTRQSRCRMDLRTHATASPGPARARRTRSRVSSYRRGVRIPLRRRGSPCPTRRRGAERPPSLQ